MRVLLIYPPAMESYGRYREAARLAAQPQMPLGIAYVAASLEQDGHLVRLIDGDVEQLDVGAIVREASHWSPQLVGVTATTPLYPLARKILGAVKEACPKAITVIGGYHFTALPEQTLADCGADYGVFGEGENTVVELVRFLEDGGEVVAVPGVYYWVDGEVACTPVRPALTDLDMLPYPARHLLRKDGYRWSVPGKGLQPVTSIMTQRGCPFPCTFCGVQTMFKGVRYRAVDSIADEMEMIYRKFGITHILFHDDTLTLNRRKVFALCQEIRRRGLPLTWEGYTRAELVTKELLAEMKAAGLVRLSFGVESGNPQILEAIQKGVTLDAIRQAYEWCHDLQLETRCSFIIGLPFETRTTVKQTVRFVKSLKCYQAYINIATPYPGTVLIRQAQEGFGGLRLLTDDWGEYRRYGNAVIEVNDLRREELIRLQQWAYRQFYLRPHIIWYNLRRAGLRAAVLNVKAFLKSVLLPRREATQPSVRSEQE